jgi:lipopolysaccharide export system protein LptA
MIMRNPMKLLAGILLLSIILVDTAGAQSFFAKLATKNNGKKKKTPTVITSDSMDFDMSKNIAVFTGNVQVDDANMRIFCEKMIIFFEGGKKGIGALVAKPNKKTEKKETDAKANPNAGKVKKIVCLKNVIIIRKLYNEKDIKAGEQKGVGGKAVYDVKAGSITLSENPSLSRGKDTLRGDIITYWVDSERVSVKSGNNHTSTLKINSASKDGKKDE